MIKFIFVVKVILFVQLQQLLCQKKHFYNTNLLKAT